MKQQSVHRIDYAKIRKAKIRLGSVMRTTSKGLKQLTAQGITSASPEDVAKALTETAVPAIEQTLAIINDVVEALPGGEEEGLGGEGEGGLGDEGGLGEEGLGGKPGLGEEEDEQHLGSFENKNTQPGFQGAMDDEDDRFKDLEEKTASLMKENINMKKAKLAERLASTYPPNMRRAAMDEFLEENDEEDDLDVLEGKVAMAEKVVKGYHDANMINKARTNQYTIPHMAKAGSKLKTAKNSSLDWRLRT